MSIGANDGHFLFGNTDEDATAEDTALPNASENAAE